MSFGGPTTFVRYRAPTGFATPKKQTTDPWGGYYLNNSASQTDIDKYNQLRLEITEKNALYAVKEIGDYAWWQSQNALTFANHKNDRMINLFELALRKHQTNLKIAADKEMKDAIDFQINRKMPSCSCNARILKDGKHYCNHNNACPGHEKYGKCSCSCWTPEKTAIKDALNRFRMDHSLVTPKMREEALAAFRADKLAKEKKKNDEEMKNKELAAQREMAAAQHLINIQENGWI